MVQIANVTPLHWRTMKVKISTLPSLVKLIYHSSYNYSIMFEILPSTPQIFPCPSSPFPFFFFFFFFTLFINNSIKFLKNFPKKKF
jgi:hypothetical protein